MKKKLFLLPILTMPAIAALLFESPVQKADGYAISSLPTTIVLKDNTTIFTWHQLLPVLF